jgi:hypothetical protein
MSKHLKIVSENKIKAFFFKIIFNNYIHVKSINYTNQLFLKKSAALFLKNNNNNIFNSNLFTKVLGTMF